jgi:predicted nucleotidyltransferase
MDKIKELIRRLVETAHPQKIYLFGSHARGDAVSRSDIDFLVVESTLNDQRKEMVRLHDAIRSMQLPVDVLVISSAAFEKWKNEPGSIIFNAINEGWLCYENTVDSQSLYS